MRSAIVRTATKTAMVKRRWRQGDTPLRASCEGPTCCQTSSSWRGGSSWRKNPWCPHLDSAFRRKHSLMCPIIQQTKQDIREWDKETDLAGNWTFANAFFRRWPKKAKSKINTQAPVRAHIHTHRPHTCPYSWGSSLIFLLGTLVVFLTTSSGVATSYVRFRSMSPQSSGWRIRGGFSSSGAGLGPLKKTKQNKMLGSKLVTELYKAAATTGLVWVLVWTGKWRCTRSYIKNLNLNETH